jgi:phosphate-selective porin OprO and OprP
MKTRVILLATAAFAALAVPALADNASVESRLDALQKLIENQQAQIEAQKSEIATLKKSMGGKKGKAPSAGTSAALPPPAPAPAPVPAALETKVADQQAAIDALTQQLEADENSARLTKQEAPVWSLAGGRPTITSSDGRFSLAIRTLVQYDQGYYSQSAGAKSLAAANGPDLSSGGNFRRAWLGVQGKLFGDWSYYLNYDFGGSNTEGPGHIQQVWLQYDGLGPFALRVGAFSPSNGLEDATSAGDTIFLERTAPADSARNLAGGDGRNAVSLVYTDDRFFGSIAYSGNKIQDSGAFDEQQAAIGRLAGLFYKSDDLNLLASLGGSYVFKPADTAAGAMGGGTISLSSAPEITVDNTATKFVTTGAIASDHSWQWGAEAAGNWKSLYAQGGYFRYGIDLRTSKAAYGFNGWYGLATWILTGESRPYNATTGAFANPKPRIPFSLNGGGYGAWELAARFSNLNFNDNAGVAGKALPTGGLRGGNQKIWTLGINWYPVSAVKIEAQYQAIDINRLGTKGTVTNTQVGQNLSTFALRTQVSF